METATFWTDALRRKLHPRRSSGVRTRPRKPAEAFARMREAWKSRAGVWAETAKWKDPGTLPWFAAARDTLSGDAGAVPPPGNPEEAAAVLAVLSIKTGWDPSNPPIGGEVVDFWFGTAGPAFAVEALAASVEIHAERGGLSEFWLRRSPAPPASPGSRGLAHGFLGPWLRLRRLLASAGEAEWERAREAAERLRSGSDHLVLRAGLAYLFPDVPEWAEEDARDTLGTGHALAHAGCLLTAVRDGDLLVRLIDLYRNSYTLVPRLDETQHEPDVAGVALSMAEGAGSAAVLALEKLLALCPNPPQRRACAEALALLPDALAVAALAVHSGLKEVVPSASEAAQRFPRLALPALATVVECGGKAGKACDPVLRQLVRQNPDLARELIPSLPAASRHILEPMMGRAAPEVVEAPFEALPPVLVQPPWTERTPQMPGFWQPAGLARPRLRDRDEALPLAAVGHLGAMLAVSRLDEPHAGLAQVRQACDPGSLAAFAWDLFQSWLAMGAPVQEAWAFRALGHLGDDACARRLAPLIRQWPAEGGHTRAVLGLDVLRAIGTDVALMLLHGIAEKARHQGIQKAAAGRIQDLADQRGLTAEEMADRLVPDLGLGPDGSLTLDFGPRSFRAGFDEHLRPFVRDAEGKRLPDLPKPGKGDDEAKAAQAQEAWKALKKDVKALAALQILRLELAMAGRRRWTPEVFRVFLAGHPLVGHLARRLVWAAYDGTGDLLGTFRVAEDGSLADAMDAPWELPADASVGLAHPLEMDTALVPRWSEVFADYEILQPFPQLGREVCRVAEEESGARQLRRFEGTEVSTGRVLKLVDHRGWRRGPPGNKGYIWYLEKPLPDGRHLARLELQPGISAGSPMEQPEQTLGAVVVNRPGSWVDEGALAFGELDPIAFSELVRDLETLRGG